MYTWTKSIAAGGFAVPAVLAMAGFLGWDNPAVRWAAPALALALLAVTGVLLIADLKHPARFYLIFTRRQWRSWLVRGAFVIGGYSGVVALYLLAAVAGQTAARQVLAWIAVPLAVATACYTAYLFAQARARDLWQSPLLAPHLAVQATLAGAAAMLPVLAWLAPGRALTAAAAVLAAAAGAARPARGRRGHTATRHGARSPGHLGDDPRAVRAVLLAGARRGGSSRRGAVDRRDRHAVRAGGPARA